MNKENQPLKIGVPKEIFPEENRVALIPPVIPSLAKAGLEVLLEKDAGSAAGFPDASFHGKGAQTGLSRNEVFSSAHVLLQVRALDSGVQSGSSGLDLYQERQIVIGFSDPLGVPERASELAKREVTHFSMELIPRITRAQSMDALSSMATVAGYKAVLLASEALPKMFPMLMTAAGTITPAKVLVIGAGVAGLQAIATARRLGAVVSAYDIRSAVKEQVESLGAKFVEIQISDEKAEDKGGYAKAMDDEFYRKQQELMTDAVTGSDVVITTAAVPGKRAPVLVPEEMVRGMAPGSVIVDLGAEQGGNCALTRPGETFVSSGVTIMGPTNLASSVPYHASQMYANNITTFLLNLIEEGRVTINQEDEIVRETLVTHNGQVVHPRVREVLGLSEAVPEKRN